ncbi:MAG: 23S rRNA (guanosine(2251)-2'-O)-methyltransferase RlmB [Pseudomonadota bacterium]
MPASHRSARSDQKAAPVKPKSARTYFLYGIHAVEAALCNPARNHIQLMIGAPEKHSLQTAYNLARQHGIKISPVPQEWFAKTWPADTSHQMIALETQPLHVHNGEDLLANHDRILVFDHINDPRNLGALMRSATAFGFTAIIQQKQGFVHESPAMAKAASGAIEHVQIAQTINLARFLSLAKRHDFWCIGLDQQATAQVHNANWPKRIMLVIGAEGKGLRPNLRSKLDMVLAICQSTEAVASLNASVAGAIAMHAAYASQQQPLQELIDAPSQIV